MLLYVLQEKAKTKSIEQNVWKKSEHYIIDYNKNHVSLVRSRVVTGRKKSKPVPSGRSKSLSRSVKTGKNRPVQLNSPDRTGYNFDNFFDRSFDLKESKKISKNVWMYISKWTITGFSIK